MFGEASYLIAPGDKQNEQALNNLVSAIAKELQKSYGAFLIVEIWAGAEVHIDEESEVRKPGFKILVEHQLAKKEFVRTLGKELSLISLDGAFANVSMHSDQSFRPLSMKEVVDTEIGAFKIGVEVSPVYRDTTSGENYVLELQSLQRQLTKSLEKTFFDFLRTETTVCPPSYLALGRKSRVHSVIQVDRILSEVASEIDFLLLVTPTNSSEAYYEFRHNLFQKEPHFTYHPAPFDPALLKRKLYSAKVEQIEDPTLAQLFREQQADIEHRISMISERGSKRFLYSSLQLYERPDQELVCLAEKILNQVPDKSPGEDLGRQLSAEEFARRAEERARVL